MYYKVIAGQQNKLEICDHMRAFRERTNLSQQELGERLGVSGNYISMLELGKKNPGPSLQKLFYALEQSPLYRGGLTGKAAQEAGAVASSFLSMLSTETLMKNFAEVAEKLSHSEVPEQKVTVGNLRVYLDEIERRLVASSGALSEAQQIALKAAGGQPDAPHEIK